MENIVNNIRKTALFLTGVLMVVWGYHANMENSGNEDRGGSGGVERQKGDGTARTITETDDAEESSGSQ